MAAKKTSTAKSARRKKARPAKKAARFVRARTAQRLEEKLPDSEKSSGPAPLLSADQLSVMEKKNLANILRKQQAGRVLNRSELETLRRASSPDVPAQAENDGDPDGYGLKVWIGPAELEKWLPSQGVKISHKNLYATYLGRDAKYRVERNAKGELHRWRTMELIRSVQNPEHVATDEILQRRQIAGARAQEARARVQEMRVAEMEGLLIPRTVIEEVWTRAVGLFLQELSGLGETLLDELVEEATPEQRGLLKDRLADLQRHLHVEFETRARQAARAAATDPEQAEEVNA